MAFELIIPLDDLPILRTILNLDKDQKKVITIQFKAYRPLKYYGEGIQSIEGFEEFPTIFKLLITLYRLSQNLLEDKRVKDIDDFISQLINSFIKQLKSKNYQFDEDFDDKIKSMKQFLKSLLGTETFLFYFHKAHNLLIERSKLILSTRIITDIRPVFKEEKIDYPNYCLITHNLKIDYSKGRKNLKKTFYALDHQDLVQLQKQIERALKKEAEMHKLCKNAGLDILME